jgi:hypothetical protein
MTPTHLYHGTSAALLPGILKTGLRPRGQSKKGNWKKNPSSPEGIYLTTAYAPYFGYVASQPAWRRKKDPRIVVLEIAVDRLDEDLLAPDEDAIEQVSRKNGDSHVSIDWSIERRTAWYRDHLHAYTGGGQWLGSLKVLGNCCHIGKIASHAITRVVTIDPAQALEVVTFATNPSISAANYHYCGHHYRGLTKWLFGDDLGDDAPKKRFGSDQLPPDMQNCGMELDYRLPPHRNGIEIIELSTG